MAGALSEKRYDNVDSALEIIVQGDCMQLAVVFVVRGSGGDCCSLLQEMQKGMITFLL